MIDKKEIDELLSKIDIVELVSEYVNLEKTGSNYKGLSPFKEEKTPSFVVSPQKKIFKCFSSGIGGNALIFYMKINNISYNEAVSILASKYNVNIKSYSKNDSIYSNLYKIMEKVSIIYHNKLLDDDNAILYLQKRGYTIDDIKTFKLGYAPEEWDFLYEKLKNEFSDNDLNELGLINISDNGKIFDFFRNRIIFPIYNSHNNIIAFGGRDISNKKDIPKYLNSKESKIFKKGNELYGIFDSGKTIKDSMYVLLVEGYFDVLSLHKNKIKTAVASLGTSITQNQVKYLSKLTNNIIICYDNDTAGQIACSKAIELFNNYEFNVKILNIPDAKDPDEYLKENSIESFKKILVNNTIDGFDYVYNKIAREFDITKTASKLEIINRMKPYFVSLKSKIRTEIEKEKLANNLSLSNTLITKSYEKKEQIKTIQKRIQNNNIYTYEDYIILYLYKFKKYFEYFEKFNFENEKYNSIYKKIKDNKYDELTDDENKAIFILDIDNLNEESLLNAYKRITLKYVEDSKQLLSEIIDIKKMNTDQIEAYYGILRMNKNIISSNNIKEVREMFNKFIEYEGRIQNV